MAKKQKILIIDDEKDLCHFLKFNLESTGDYIVYTATNGEQGIRLADRKKPDLILVDIMMPNTDGFEVLRSIKEKPQTTTIPVLMLTALEQDMPKIMANELYANDYLTKPIHMNELIAKIQNALAR